MLPREWPWESHSDASPTLREYDTPATRRIICRAGVSDERNRRAIWSTKFACRYRRAEQVAGVASFMSHHSCAGGLLRTRKRWSPRSAPWRPRWRAGLSPKWLRSGVCSWIPAVQSLPIGREHPESRHRLPRTRGFWILLSGPRVRYQEAIALGRSREARERAESPTRALPPKRFEWASGEVGVRSRSKPELLCGAQMLELPATAAC